MATRIGIISDTHIPSSIPELWPEVEIVFKDVDIILHAGDLITTGVVDWLERIAPTYAAEGNHDYGLSDVDKRIRPKWFFKFEGFSLGLIHIIDGWGSRTATDLVKTYLGTTPDGLLPDIVVCGDSHFEFIRNEDGMLIINGGSATYPHNREARLGHVVLLDIEQGKEPEARIIDLTEYSIDGTDGRNRYSRGRIR